MKKHLLFILIAVLVIIAISGILWVKSPQQDKEALDCCVSYTYRECLDKGYYKESSNNNSECEQYRYCSERNDIKQSDGKDCYVWYVFGAAVVKAQIIIFTIVNLIFLFVVALLAKKKKLVIKGNIKTIISLIGVYLGAVIFTILFFILSFLLYIVLLKSKLFIIPVIIIIALITLIYILRKKH